MYSFSLKTFGVGDGWPCGDRNHAAFVYRIGNATLLIDCGEPFSSRFKASGASYDSFDSILISHLHCDHIGSLFMFVQSLWLERRTRALQIHMPRDGIQPVRSMLNASCIFDELLAFPLKFTPLQAKEPILVNDVRITAFATTHLESLRQSFQSKYPQDFAAFSFLMETDQLRVGHSADIGCPEDLDPMFEKPLDLLVCELAHFKPEDLYQYLKTKSLKRLVLTHLSRPHWENLEETRALALKSLPGVEVVFAQDLGEIRF